MKDNKFLKELQVLGLNPTPKQVKHLQSLAIKQFKKEKTFPVFNEDRWYHYIVLLMAYTKVNNELCFWIDENSVKHKLKQSFKQLKRLTREVCEEFENLNKDNEVLMNAYNAFTDDLSEMFHIHLDTIYGESKS